jgi:hypothetical protein
VDQLYTQVAEQSAAAGTPSADLRRTLLEQALKFYHGFESRASSPEERARARDTVRQIRSRLGDKTNEPIEKLGPPA